MNKFVTYFVSGAGVLAMTVFGSGVALAGNGYDGGRDRVQVNPLVRNNQFDFNRNRNRDRDVRDVDFRNNGNQFDFNRNRNNNRGQLRVLCQYLRNHLDSRADFQNYLRLCLNNHQISPYQYNEFMGAYDRGNNNWNRDGRRNDRRNQDFSEVINLSEQSSFNLSEQVSNSVY